MNKEALIAAGFTEEQAKKVMDLHKADINGNYIPKTRFDEINEQLKNIKTELTERDSQIASLKKFEGNSKELADKVKELQEQNKQKAAEFEKALKETKLKNAVRTSLGDSVFDSSLVMGLIDMRKIDLDDKDEVKSGLKEQVELLKKEKAFLFKEPNAPKKPGIKVTGQTPADGDDGDDKDTSAVAFAKKLAQDTAKASIGAAQKAEEIYFGKK